MPLHCVYCNEMHPSNDICNEMWASHAKAISPDADRLVRDDGMASGCVHTDHPLRHYDRTCPACQQEEL